MHNMFNVICVINLVNSVLFTIEFPSQRGMLRAWVFAMIITD